MCALLTRKLTKKMLTEKLNILSEITIPVELLMFRNLIIFYATITQKTLHGSDLIGLESKSLSHSVNEEEKLLIIQRWRLIT